MTSTVASQGALGDAAGVRARLDERLRFETLLGDLSASFVSVPADQIDALIEDALRRIVQFLGVDRASFGEYLEAQRSLLVTHSYAEPGIPPMPPSILDDQLPWYTEKIRQGGLLCWHRLPEELPPEAVKEREYVTRVGLKSNLTIPLKVSGALL